MRKLTKKERFNEKVLSKYNIYNSIFSTLPYENIYNTGYMLPLFSELCKSSYEKNMDPESIVESFFNQYCSEYSEKDKFSLLFKFIQYVERQIVLFDAIEDAAFPEINNLDGIGTLRGIKELVESLDKKNDLKKFLTKAKVRPVLTAHPTQFYPGSVLGIITDLTFSVKKNDIQEIKNLLSQLAMTPFFKNKKPTPYDEAVSLSWYLENVFYHSIAEIYKYINNNIFDGNFKNFDLLSLGFWPGGDRDGNPYVTSKITLDTAKKLRSDIIKNYYKDIRKLRRKLTFKVIEDIIIDIEKKLYDSIFISTQKPKISLDELKNKLSFINETLIASHNSIYTDEVQQIINKVNIFGYHFASLDIRQDSRVHSNIFDSVFSQGYLKSSMKQRESLLYKVLKNGLILNNPSKILTSTLKSITSMKSIQSHNGEKGCYRYIISNTQSYNNILEVLALLKLSGWKKPSVDIVPLFETIPDLKICAETMEKMYNNSFYMSHLQRRNYEQTIMLGFSDGTKDGGYLTANWSILKAKESLTKISRKYGVKLKLFDGRGGPPSRGGGNTHQFYSSLGSFIESDEIQLTIQGQTISSNFGTFESSQYNLEQLLSSGIKNELINDQNSLSKENRNTIEKLSKISYEKYLSFKNHEKFLPYLEKMSTIKYYAKTNIGSRPSKRNTDGSDEFKFEDLRAIPFVGGWSQLKQNVPGFFGLGSAIYFFQQKNDISKVKRLYREVPFFRALVSNSMMSLTKSFFKLTAYMKDDEEFGDFWKIIFEEYQLTKKMLLKISGFKSLMENEPANKLSIQTRENIVLPLITIQQYSLQKIQKIISLGESKDLKTYQKIVTRSLFGNINASRNSA